MKEKELREEKSEKREGIRHWALVIRGRNGETVYRGSIGEIAFLRRSLPSSEAKGSGQAPFGYSQ